MCRVVRLGEKVHENRFFLPEALKRADAALKEFSELINRHSVEKVVATATSAARDVSNGQDLIKLGAKYQIPITIIEGEREATLSFEGALSGFTSNLQKSILVVDVGGGSTELIFREAGAKAIVAKSFDIGCVRLTEMFLKQDPIAIDELNSLSTFASKTLSTFGPVHPESIVAVAGTPTTLACVAQGIDFNEAQVDGYLLTKGQIELLTSRLSSMPLAERKKLKGLEPLRAEVIIAGGALLISALDISGASEMTVSTRGLRYGVALHYKEF